MAALPGGRGRLQIQLKLYPNFADIDKKSGMSIGSKEAAMKINAGIQPLARPQNKTIKGSSARKSADAQSAQEEGDAFSVKFSSTTEKLLSGTPSEETINWEKVTSIKDQLAAGTYNISGKDVASKMLNALSG
jgi:flagellar biosynthesis anti-sigma factor FlgM